MSDNKAIKVLLVSSLVVNGIFLGLVLSESLLNVEVDNQVTPIVQPNVSKTVINRSVVSKNVINRSIIKPLKTANIQPSHRNVQVDLEGSDAVISDVDAYGRLYGSSMQPTIFDGNTVISREFDGQDIEEGDIVRYERDESYVLHRVTGDYQHEGYVETKGDNNKHTDGRIQVSDITHIVIGVIFTDNK